MRLWFTYCRFFDSVAILLDTNTDFNDFMRERINKNKAALESSNNNE